MARMRMAGVDPESQLYYNRRMAMNKECDCLVVKIRWPSNETKCVLYPIKTLFLYEKLGRKRRHHGQERREAGE